MAFCIAAASIQEQYPIILALIGLVLACIEFGKYLLSKVLPKNGSSTATKDDLSNLATKQDLCGLPTKSDLNNFATSFSATLATIDKNQALLAERLQGQTECLAELTRTMVKQQTEMGIWMAKGCPISDQVEKLIGEMRRELAAKHRS